MTIKAGNSNPSKYIFYLGECTVILEERAKIGEVPIHVPIQENPRRIRVYCGFEQGPGGMWFRYMQVDKPFMIRFEDIVSIKEKNGDVLLAKS